VERTQVIVLSQQEETARDITARWREPHAELNIKLLTHEHLAAAQAISIQTIVVAGPDLEQRDEVLNILDHRQVPTLYILGSGESMETAMQNYPSIHVFSGTSDGMNSLVRTGSQIQRRLSAECRAEKTTAELHLLSSQAQLGRYIIDVRHNFNNCLTAVLGNAELLLMENGNLPMQIKEQLDTILSMALRMHQMMQRFSSLETEMHFAERHSHGETKAERSAYVSGS